MDLNLRPITFYPKSFLTCIKTTIMATKSSLLVIALLVSALSVSAFEKDTIKNHKDQRKKVFMVFLKRCIKKELLVEDS